MRHSLITFHVMKVLGISGKNSQLQRLVHKSFTTCDFFLLRKATEASWSNVIAKPERWDGLVITTSRGSRAELTRYLRNLNMSKVFADEQCKLNQCLVFTSSLRSSFYLFKEANLCHRPNEFRALCLCLQCAHAPGNTVVHILTASATSVQCCPQQELGRSLLSSACSVAICGIAVRSKNILESIKTRSSQR